MCYEYDVMLNLYKMKYLISIYIYHPNWPNSNSLVWITESIFLSIILDIILSVHCSSSCEFSIEFHVPFSIGPCEYVCVHKSLCG